MERTLSVDEEWAQEQEQIRAHYSSLTLHRKCPQAWYYRYGLKLYKPITDPAPHLNFGSWFGMWRAAESLERGRALDSLKQKPGRYGGVGADRDIQFDMRTVTTAEVEAVADAWWATQSQEVKDVWDEKLGEGLPDRLRGSTVRWMDEWGDELANERPLGVEIFWQRELPRPSADREFEGVSYDQLPALNLIGFIDEAYYDIERNMVVVRDNKTQTTMSSMTSFDDMMDSQLMLYAWGAAPAIAEWELGPPRAVAYDRTRSTKATTPRLTSTGRLAANITDFDLRTYREFAAGPDGLGAPWVGPKYPGRDEYKPGGLYQEDPAMVEKLSSFIWRERFHQRTLRPLSIHVVRAHLRAAVDSATDIWRTQKRTEVTSEAGRNLTKEGCRWCDYAPLCRAQMVGGPTGDYELSDYGLNATGRETRLAGGQLV